VITADTPIPKVDVLLLFDVTTSMDDEIATVKENASYFMETLKAKVDAAFGVGSFSDYPQAYDYAGYRDESGAVPEYGAPNDYPWLLNLDITTDTVAVQSTLDALELRDGRDRPESYSRALSEAISVSWRAETKKVIVLFGDSIAHDAEFFLPEFGVNTGVDPGGDEKAGTEDDLAFTRVVEEMKGRGIEVIPINSAPADDKMVEMFFYYLAAETGGKSFNLTSATEAPEAMVLGLEAATTRIKELTIAPEADFSPWVTVAPLTYDDVGGGESRSFDVTITVPDLIEPSRLYEFDLTVFADGASLNVYHVVVGVPQ
jgi:hypothetical protein